MSDERTNALAARALAHLEAGSTDQSAELMRLPVAAYLDADRYERELDAVFRRSPIAVCLSLDLPAPGTYLALTLVERPLLVTRDASGVVRVFLNACRHRGAQVCEEGRGERSRFSCPYHAWTYDAAGALVAVYGEEKFGAFDHGERGLTELACAERSGVVFACLTPGVSLDVDQWLGGMKTELDTLQLADWVLWEQRDIEGAGWKATMDGYLEVYHHDVVHRSTVGRHTLGNLLVHDTFGPHQRLCFGRHNLGELAAQPRDQWRAEKHIRLIHSVFPNLSVSGIVGGHCLVSQILPGETLDETMTRQSILCAPRAADESEEDWQAAAADFSRLTLEAVRDEDYRVVASVQRTLRSGANETFLLGRNEPAVQHYHRMVERVSDAQAANGP